MKQITKKEMSDLIEWVQKDDGEVIQINNRNFINTDYYDIIHQTKNTLKLKHKNSTKCTILNIMDINIQKCEIQTISKTDLFLYFPEVNDINEILSDETHSMCGDVYYSKLPLRTKKDSDGDYMQYQVKYIKYYTSKNNTIIYIYNTQNELEEICEIKYDN